MMFKYLRRKLGITDLEKTIKEMPILNERYLKLLLPLEALLARLNEPDGDDTLVMHHMRCMGYFGGWKIRDAYLEGKKHGKSEQ